MAKKTLQVEVSNATPMQVQTLKIELMLMARQWFRKVKVKIEVIKLAPTPIGRPFRNPIKCGRKDL